VEGGDVAWLDEKTLAVGHTYRTNEEGIRQLKQLVEPNGVNVIVVPLPHYKGPSDVFHLMSILSPVDKDLAVVYSPLMPIVFRNLLLEKGYQLVEVPDDEFDELSNQNGFMPAPYMARAKWVLATDPSNLNKKEWERYIKQSYELVKIKLTKKLREKLGI